MTAIRSRGRRSVAVPVWRTEDVSLDPFQFRIACWIASHTDSYRDEHVTRNEIARRTGVSAGKVTSSLQALKLARIIDVHSVNGRLQITFDFGVWEQCPDGDAPGHVVTGGGHVVTADRSCGDRLLSTHKEDSLDLGLEDRGGPAHRELTAGQVAHMIQRGYWDWVREKSGRYPIAMNVPAFKAIVTPFLEAGIEGPAIKQAVAAMYERGATLTKAGLERELDGRSATRKDRARLSTSTLRFDEEGNRIR